jgi:hypothetical protein
LLEQLTGESFEDNSKTLQDIYLSKEKEAEIITKVKSGYYTEGAIQKRKEEKASLEKRKQFDEIKKDLESEIKKHTTEYNVKHAILSNGLSIKNIIYYNHKNECVFNWKDWDDKITQEQFDLFLSAIAKQNFNLPEGITFKLSK